MHKIDLDRGCIARAHPQTRTFIYMYHDDPGVYYYPNGETAPADVAQAAGYHVDGEKRAREKQRRIAAERERIEAEYATSEERIDRELAADEAEADPGGYTAEPGGTTKDGPTPNSENDVARMVTRGGGYWDVFTKKDDEKINSRALRRDQAEALLRELEVA